MTQTTLYDKAIGIEKIHTAHSILDPQEEKPYVLPNIKVDCFLFP